MTRMLFSLCPVCDGVGHNGRYLCPAQCAARHVVESGLSEAQAEALVKRRQEALAEAMTLRAEVRALRRQVEGLAARVAAQSELLARFAEKGRTPGVTP